MFVPVLTDNEKWHLSKKMKLDPLAALCFAKKKKKSAHPTHPPENSLPSDTHVCINDQMLGDESGALLPDNLKPLAQTDLSDPLRCRLPFNMCAFDQTEPASQDEYATPCNNWN